VSTFTASITAAATAANAVIAVALQKRTKFKHPGTNMHSGCAGELLLPPSLSPAVA